MDSHRLPPHQDDDAIMHPNCLTGLSPSRHSAQLTGHGLLRFACVADNRPGDRSHGTQAHSEAGKLKNPRHDKCLLFLNQQEYTTIIYLLEKKVNWPISHLYRAWRYQPMILDYPCYHIAKWTAGRSTLPPTRHEMVSFVPFILLDYQGSCHWRPLTVDRRPATGRRVGKQTMEELGYIPLSPGISLGTINAKTLPFTQSHPVPDCLITS